MLLAGLQVPIALIEVPTGLDICAHFVQPGEEVVLAGSRCFFTLASIQP
jgi:hypothetical protein